MKVLAIHNAGATGLPSGESIVFDAETEALEQAGCQVVRYRNSPPARRIVGLAARANVFWSVSAYRAIRGLIRRERPDIAHVHGVLPNLTVSAFAACRDAGIPVVQTLHNYRWFCVEGGMFRQGRLCDACLAHGQWQGVRYRCCRNSSLASLFLAVNNMTLATADRLSRYVDRFVAVSQFVLDVHVRAGFEPARLQVKYNGIRLAPRVLPRDQRQSATVVFAGRLDVAKGTALLIQLPRLLPSVSFQWIGSGPDEPQLRHQVEEYRLKNVAFLGHLRPAEVQVAIRQASCSIIPSRVPESFGLVAAESLASGTPVVVTRIAGLAELVERSQGGVCIAPNEGAEAFAASLQQMIADRDLWRHCSEQGRSFAERELAIEGTTQQLLRIYEAVCT